MTALRSRKGLQASLGVLASAFFLWLAFRGVDFATLLEVLASADWGLVFLAAVCEVLALWFRAIRWGILLENLCSVTVGPLFRATLIGYMINFTLPVRVGEVARAHVLGKELGLSRISVFGTVVAERILDAASVIVIALLWFLFSGFPREHAHLSNGLTAATLVMAGLVVVLMVGLWVLVRHTDWLLSVISYPVGLASKGLAAEVRWRIQLLADGLGPLQLRSYLRLGLHTLVIWCLSLAALMILGAGLSMTLTIGAASLVLVALALGVSVPSGPGFVGTFHYAVVVALEAYGVDASTALGYAIVVHAVSTLPIIALGIAVLWRRHLSVGAILSERPPDRQ